MNIFSLKFDTDTTETLHYRKPGKVFFTFEVSTSEIREVHLDLYDWFEFRSCMRSQHKIKEPKITLQSSLTI